MNENPKWGRMEPIFDKQFVDRLEELRQEAIQLFEQSIADDDDIDDNLAEAIYSIGDANAYFLLYRSAVDRAERALNAYRKEEEEHGDPT